MADFKIEYKIKLLMYECEVWTEMLMLPIMKSLVSENKKIIPNFVDR